MDLQTIIPVLIKWVKVNTDNKKPGVSYIQTIILNYGATRSLIEDMDALSMLKLFYIIYFMIEGDTFEIASEKSENLKTLVTNEVKNIAQYTEVCDDCVGDGFIECPTCDGDGEEECNVCDGDGIPNQQDTDSDGESCDNCEGSGRDTCGECYGDGTVECNVCDGDGTSEDGRMEVESEDTTLIFYSPTIFAKLDKLEDSLDNKPYDDSVLNDILDSEGSGDIMYMGLHSDTVFLDEYANFIGRNEDEINDGDEYIVKLMNGVPNIRLHDSRSNSGVRLRV